MKEERNVITIDEYGRLNMPTDTAAIWMTETEIVELFGTTAGAVHTGIKAILKENALHDYEVCACVRLDSGNSADVYNLEMVVALDSVFVRRAQRNSGSIYSVHSVQWTNSLQ